MSGFCNDFCSTTFEREQEGYFGGEASTPEGHCVYCGAVIANVQGPNPFDIERARFESVLPAATSVLAEQLRHWEQDGGASPSTADYVGGIAELVGADPDSRYDTDLCEAVFEYNSKGVELEDLARFILARLKWERPVIPADFVETGGIVDVVTEIPAVLDVSLFANGVVFLHDQTFDARGYLVETQLWGHEVIEIGRFASGTVAMLVAMHHVDEIRFEGKPWRCAAGGFDTIEEAAEAAQEGEVVRLAGH